MRRAKKSIKQPERRLSAIKTGDTVMVIAGGNSKKRPNKGKTGKVLRFVGTERVVVEGLNLTSRYEKATPTAEAKGKVMAEASIHISNVMYFAEKLKRPVRLHAKKLGDGTKVRGYLDPKTKEFEQI